MRKIFINTILIFLLCGLFHFGYDIFPNFITSLLFPVNESVWEHLKMIFTATVFFSFLSNFYYHEKNIMFKTYIRVMATILILLMLYLPVYYLVGEHLVLTMIILLISIFVSEIIANKISTKKHYSVLNKISVFLLIITFILFSIFTYYPIHTFLFLDQKTKQYGI